MSKLPRPGFNYRVARRNAWKAIPQRDRPTWAEFNRQFQRSGHDIVEGVNVTDNTNHGMKLAVHGKHAMQHNRSKYAASYDGPIRSLQRK